MAKNYLSEFELGQMQRIVSAYLDLAEMQVTAEIAKAHAESEFEKYRIVQDRLFESDFDKMVRQIEAERQTPALLEAGAGKPAKVKKGK